MITWRNFVQLTLLMLGMFLLFHFATFAAAGGDTELNNRKEVKTLPAAVSQEPVPISEESGAVSCIVVTGGEAAASPASEALPAMLKLMKRQAVYADTIYDVSPEAWEQAEILILTSSESQGVYDSAALKEQMGRGVSVIFAQLPKLTKAEPELLELLGVSTAGSTYRQKGIRLLSGFLLGGLFEYPDLEAAVQRVELNSTCKVYAVGLVEDQRDLGIKNEELPPLIWRNQGEGMRVYAVNGPFLEDLGGTGFLSALFSEIYPDYLYPVINAKAFFVGGFPCLSQEGSEEILRRYSRTSLRFQEDIALPDLLTLCSQNDLVPSLYTVQSFESGEESTGNTGILSFFQTELAKAQGELGLSGSTGMTAVRLKEELEYFEDELPEYHFDSLMSNGMNEDQQKAFAARKSDRCEITSVISGWEEAPQFYRIGETAVNLPVIAEGFWYEDQQWLRLKSMATALGVVTYRVNMEEIWFPESDRYDWKEAFKELSRNIHTYFEPYAKLDGLNAAQTALRTACYLNQAPEISYGTDRVEVRLDSSDAERYFLLRTDKEIRQVNGGTSRQMEEGVYLITAEEPEVSIDLKQKEVYQ